MQVIFEQYDWKVIKCEPLHQGLINQTYVVTTTDGCEYILQTINHKIFNHPSAIDYNIHCISAYLVKHGIDYLFTHLIPNKLGQTLLFVDGVYYRAFRKINASAYSVLTNCHQAKEAATQFANFTHVLAGFDTDQLQITIPDFHNLSLRFHQFNVALKDGNQNRIQQANASIQYLLDQRLLVEKFEQFISHPDSHLRVTHHDTKISNVLFDETDRAICVIDLDTVMAGYFISDVGDMCRTYLCDVSEEESNLSLVKIDLKRFEAIKEGYLSHMQSHLSRYEMDHFNFSGQFMIYMQALRFLTDYLNGDVYYGSKYEGQNYVRALNQIQLLKSYNTQIGT